MLMGSDGKVLYLSEEVFAWPMTWHAHLWRMTWHRMSRMCSLAHWTFGVDFSSLISFKDVVELGNRI